MAVKKMKLKEKIVNQKVSLVLVVRNLQEQILLLQKV